MSPEFRFSLLSILCCCLWVVSPVMAMSQSPDETPVKPVAAADAKASQLAARYMNKNPEADAQAAIEKGDLRLLAFPQRVTNVPGVEAADRQTAMDACGVSLMAGFSDALHSDEEAEAMRVAYDYAKRYNAVMVKRCLNRE